MTKAIEWCHNAVHLCRNMAHFAMPSGNALIRRTIKQQEERM